jgi:AcrR family transcriptional regulator
MTRQLIDQYLILDHAVMLAKQSSWQSFTLYQLASSLNCSLIDIKHYFRSKDDIAEALFDRADDAMLDLTVQADYRALSIDQRLFESIMCWFDTLAHNKSLVREILAYKCELGHFHLQAHGITRISRTVQWFLAAAGRENTGLGSTADEIAVTSAYLASFAVFLFDYSANHHNTRKLLKRLIRNITRAQQCLTCHSNISKQ